MKRLFFAYRQKTASVASLPRPCIILTICEHGLFPIGVRSVSPLSPAWGRASERTHIVLFCNGISWQRPWRPLGDMTARGTYHGLHSKPRAATASVIVEPMTRAVALAVADHGSTMARAMATAVVCSAIACHGSQW